MVELYEKRFVAANSESGRIQSFSTPTERDAS